MYLVDSHCHLDQLDLSAHNGKLDNALDAANQNDVKHMLCVCITLDEFPKMMEIVKHRKNISASVGLHPNEEVTKEPTVDELITLANHPKIIAIGETGLDYYRSQGDTEWQRERFRNHIGAAKKTKNPLIVHSRQAKEDTLKIIRDEHASEVAGVLHCFTEDWDMAKRALDLNFYISFSGIVTFKNATQIQEVAKKMPRDKILIETDSPYLAPVPYRGKTNEPAYVRHVAEFLAELRGEDFEKFAETTTENFFKLFHKASH